MASRAIGNAALISIVDDDVSVRESLTGLMDSMGIAAQGFSTAEQFLKSDEVSSTSCLIADVHMRGMTGLELHDCLVNSGNTIPTILMTADPAGRLRARALASGVAGYLTKPFTDTDLLGCVRSALTYRKQELHNDASEPRLVETYRFRPEDLRPATRAPGISAFMRVRNGADFLEATVRSHLSHFDEIVIVYNQCSDATPDILARLRVEFGNRVRTFHYRPRVFAPGSIGHAREPADSPASFVNMSNFALVQTRFRVAVKLDDDHLALSGRLQRLTEHIRSADFHLDKMLCCAGINLARDAAGTFGVLRRDPLVGSGDLFFFEVTPETYFTHDRRFETFRHDKPRVFADFTYAHVKFLKSHFGFASRDIEEGGNPRFWRKREEFLADRRVISLDELSLRAPRWLDIAALAPLPEKARLKIDRWRRFVRAAPSSDELRAALDYCCH